MWSQRDPDPDSDAASDSSELAEYLKRLENVTDKEEIDRIVNDILLEMGA